MDILSQEKLIRIERENFITEIEKERPVLPRDVATILQAIHKHLFEEGYNVSQAKEEVGYRDNNLSTRFRRHMNLGMREYIESRRIEFASKLLQARDLQLFVVASQIGYSYQESFNRAFRRCTGFSPKGFREKLGQEIMLRRIVKQRTNKST